MKKLTLLLMLLTAASAIAQQVASDAGNRAACTSSCGSGGPLGSNWTLLGTLNPANPGFYAVLSYDDATTPYDSTSPYGTYDGESMAYYSGATFAADQYSQIDCSSMTQGSQYSCGVLLRMSSGNGYTCSWSNDYANGHSELYIGKYTGGSYSSGDLVGYYTWNQKPGVILCTAVGNVLTMYNNGVQVLTATDSTYASGYPGLDLGNGSNMPAVNWVAGNNYTVTTYTLGTSAGTGGTIAAGGTYAAGATYSITVTPSNGYVVSSVSGCGGSLSGNTFTGNMPSSNCTVTAAFTAIPPSTTTGPNAFWFGLP